MSPRYIFRWILVALGVLFATLVVSLLKGSPTLPLPVHADRVVVIKHEHTMMLMREGRVLKTYRVALGRGGLGQKMRAGDDKVPEGVYRIVGRNEHSGYYRALRVGYPTPQQVLDAHRRGVDPGGDIMIHGIRNGLGWVGRLHRYVDWTKGCIAVTDREMDEIWRAVPVGTPVEIRP